jgi:hypothetical protein
VEEPPSEKTAPGWFVLSEQFTPSGFMGEAGERHVLKLYMDRCPKRAEGALGSCYTFDYRPQFLADDATEVVDGVEKPLAVKWFGVAWQSPPNNWGEQPGKIVGSGGERVRYRARASRPITLKVEAGGIGLKRPNSSEPFPHHDSFVIPVHKCNLTPDKWSSCSFKLIDNYNKPIFGSKDELEILGPFKWSVDNPTREPVTIYLDDIVWE